ncbi:MAG: polysaccharide biosynthesis C-terminal domain-containing protein [Clostridia bacterium]|nr:polysaccharide biosynthesis C-terminal domain-containing protein [Clostridia bacterium]
MRSKRALYNIISSLSFEIVTLICGLITPRLILSTFGSDYNGVTSSITQFLSMISILRMGVAGATRVELYKTLAANDNEGTSGIVRATELYMRKISGIFLVYALALGVIYPYISHNDVSVGGNFALVLIIGIGTFTQYCFGMAYSCLLDADQRGYIYSLFRIVATILNTVIAYFLIKLGSSIYVVKLGSSICFAAVPIFLSIYVKVKYKIKRNVEPNKKALQQKNTVMMHSVANIVHSKTDIFVLTLFSEARNISVYNVYNSVIGNLRLIMRSFTNGLEAAFGSMWVRGEKEKLIDCFSAYEFLMHSFVSVVFSCVLVLIIPFVMLYTKGVTDVNYNRLSFAIALTVSEGLYCIREPYVTLVQATGKYKETRNAAIYEAAINVVLSVILVNAWGITGVVIGTIVANLYRTISYGNYISKNIITFRFSEVLKRICWTTANVVLIVILVGKILPVQSIDTWTKWVLNGFLCFSVGCAFTVISGLVFYRKDLLKAIQFTKRMFSRGRKIQA